MPTTEPASRSEPAGALAGIIQAARALVAMQAAITDVVNAHFERPLRALPEINAYWKILVG